MEATAAAPNLAVGRSEIGGYAVSDTLLPDQSWLAAAPGGRQVVLKALDEDCLWKGQLHPNVKDRLGRVRELAHSGVANLYGVERDGRLTFLVWEYIPGETLAERATNGRCGQRDFLMLARELVLGVEMLHARGIVHGTLKPSNIIVDESDRVVLTHVSPLLYSEPSEDVAAVIALLVELVQARGETATPLGRLLDRSADEEMSPRRLAVKLGALIESRESDASSNDGDRQVGRQIRRRAMAGATATAILAVMLFVGMRQLASARTPKAPVAPQAGREAMQPVERGDAAVGAAKPGKRAAQ